MVAPAGHRCSKGALIAFTVVGILLAGCTSQDGSNPDAPTTAAPTPTASPSPRPTSTPAEASQPLHYVALGDSLASGLGGHPSYVDLYRRHLHQRTKRPVRLTNLGRPGWTSTQLLAALRSDDRFRNAVASADVVTWDIGGNDILQAALRSFAGGCSGGARRCLRDARADFTANWESILDELTVLTAGRAVQLQTFDLYTPFVTLPGVPRDTALSELKRMNTTIRASSRRAGIDVARVQEAFRQASDGPLIAADGVHPTAAGHTLIARLLSRQFRTPRAG